MKKPKKPLRKEYWAGDSIENDEERYIYGLKQYAEKAEKYIEFLEDCREYDASNKNRPDGYIVPNYYTSKRQSK